MRCGQFVFPLCSFSFSLLKDRPDMNNSSAAWQHGYYAADGYTYGYYREMTPTHLAWAALLQGEVMPLQRFRYVDLGCGQGFNLILLAACFPDSQFLGIDFMPAHMRHARKLAEEAGLTNIRFVEADFLQLAQSPVSLLDASGGQLDGQADYAVAHGIASWVSPTVRASVWALASRLLRPGGLYYTSYNTLPGWLSAQPFQHLVRLNARTAVDGPAAVRKALETFARLEEAKAPIFSAQPSLKSRLKAASEQDMAYVTQEYNNQSWQPLYVADMMAEAQAVKLTWLGTATLPDMFDGLLPAAAARLIQAESDPVLRESLRDIATLKAFRRDLYVKGKAPAWAGERQRHVTATRFVSSPFKALPEGSDGKLELPTSAGKISFDRGIFKNVLDITGQPGGASLDEIQARTGDASLSDTVQKVSLMLDAGWIQIPLAAPANAARLNLAIARAVRDGAPYRALAVPGVGQATAMDALKALLLAESAQAGQFPAQAPAAEVLLEKLAQLRRTLTISLEIAGTKHTAGPAFDAELERLVREFVGPFWQAGKSQGML